MNLKSKIIPRKFPQPPFLPVSKKEAEKLHWIELDIIIVSGDAYIDHPSFGAALIGRILVAAGYKVGIIPQPNLTDPRSLKIFGKPRIAFAISSGNIDSYLKNYTAARRFRREDDYSEGGKTGQCPPNASVIYANFARGAFPGTKIILGGIEASMRRVVYYDYWQDKIRPSILAESKADYLVYGMGEKTILELVQDISKSNESFEIRGTARLAGAKESQNVDESKYRILPSFSEILSTPEKLLESAIILEEESNPFNARALLQKHNERALIVNSPQFPLTQDELDLIYDLPFSYAPHPMYKKPIPAFEMIKNSVTAVRGCPGGCSFCSLALHQGKFVVSRSEKSILNEIKKISSKKYFKGTISDVGGPTANCYASSQILNEGCKKCRKVSCFFPEICHHFRIDDAKFAKLLRDASSLSGVKNIFVSSGIRTDLALRQKQTTREIIRHHVSGHLKIAPEHLHEKILRLMRKNKSSDFFEFLKLFNEESLKIKKEQYIVPYFISNFPGSGDEEFKVLERFLRKSQWRLQQIQDFIPLPGTLAAAMYYCEKSPDGKKLRVKKGLRERRFQLQTLKGEIS